MISYPQTQSELIKLARGDMSQVEFARLLGCDRSCLSRYEREVLGAPPHGKRTVIPPLRAAA